MEMSDSEEEYDSSDSPAYLGGTDGDNQVKPIDLEEGLSSDSSEDEHHDTEELSTSHHSGNPTGVGSNETDKEETGNSTGQMIHSPLSEDENQTRDSDKVTTDDQGDDSLFESTKGEDLSPGKSSSSQKKTMNSDDQCNQNLDNADTAGIEQAGSQLDVSDLEELDRDAARQEEVKDSADEEQDVFDYKGSKQEESAVSKKRKRALSSDGEDDLETILSEKSGRETIEEEEASQTKKRKIEEGGDRDSEDRDSVSGDGGGSDAGSLVGNTNEQEISELQEEVSELGGTAEVGGIDKEGEGEPDSDEDDQPGDSRQEYSGLSDWDVMMARRKEAMARTRRRRRKDIDITASDDYIMNLISKMRLAAEQDRQLNLARKPATKKLQLLPTLLASLKKADLQTAFIECGILSAMSEWLTPLPDHSLPHLKIRDGLLDVLKTFPVLDANLLKSSKIGKAVMLLYKHPKETRRNRERAGKIVNEWARPIFGLASDFKSLSRDEREKRDYSHLSQAARRRLSSGERERPSQDDDLVPQKPGDKGWIGRARVPMPSTNDYVVRPKWNVEQDFKKTSPKKVLDRYEKHLRKQKQQKMQGKSTHAASLSIEGRHMPL